MSIESMSDKQILAFLGERLEKYRRSNHMQDQEIFDMGGVKKDALANFKKGRNVSLVNFIKILRGAGLLDRLNYLIPQNDSFSPIEQIRDKKNRFPARIHKKKNDETVDFEWGDE